MVALLSETFETGPNLARITTVNTKASTVVLGTGNDQIFSNDYPSDPELLGLKVLLAATNASLSEYPFGTSQSGRVVVRIEGFRFLTAGVSFRPLCMRNNTPANAGHLAITNSNTVSLISAAGSTVTGSGSTTVLTANTPYDLEFAVTKGTTTSDGVIEYRIYPYGSGTATETKTITAQNTAIVDLLSVRLGTSAVASAAETWWTDNLQVHALASGWVGPTVSPPVLTTSLIGDKAIIDARGSTAGAGGGLSWSISPTTGVVALTDGVWAVPRGVTYTVTVLETSGLSDNTPAVIVPVASTAAGYTILVGNGTAFV